MWRDGVGMGGVEKKSKPNNNNYMVYCFLVYSEATQGSLSLNE